MNAVNHMQQSRREQTFSRQNNFDAIRLFAACQVVYFHGIKHLGVPIENPCVMFINDILIAFPGVPIFFVVSGFLIPKSYEASMGCASRYFVNRFLRIYPALWLGYLVSLVALGLCGFVTEQSFRSGQFYLWFVGQISFFQYYTPDFLRGYGVGTPNGSLWTIPVEIEFYIAVPLIYLLLGRMRTVARANILLVIMAVLSAVLYSVFLPHMESTVPMKLLFVSLFPYLWMFLLGALAYSNFSFLRKFFENKLIYWLGGYLLVVLLNRSFPYYPLHSVFSYMLLAMVVLSAAFSFRGFSERVLKGYDVSYGIYIFHMIIVNVMVSHGAVGRGLCLLKLFGFTFLAGLLSWILLERRMLALKNSLEGRIWRG